MNSRVRIFEVKGTSVRITHQAKCLSLEFHRVVFILSHEGVQDAAPPKLASPPEIGELSCPECRLPASAPPRFIRILWLHNNFPQTWAFLLRFLKPEN